MFCCVCGRWRGYNSLVENKRSGGWEDLMLLRDITKLVQKNNLKSYSFLLHRLKSQNLSLKRKKKIKGR